MKAHLTPMRETRRGANRKYQSAKKEAVQHKIAYINQL